MYLCFCKLPSLQWYFVDCAKSDCDSDSSSKAAIEFGTGVCAGEFFYCSFCASRQTSNQHGHTELGFPIDTADLTSPPATKEATLSMPSSSKTASTAAETTSAEASATETSTDDDATAAVTSSTVSQASETSTAETSTAENTSAEESETDASSTDAVASASDAAASASASVVDSMANSASFSGLVAAAGVAVAVFGLF